MKQCGIYIIQNTLNGKRYIGSSQNIRRRLLVHKRLLRTNTHINNHLQNAFNCDGEDNFDFYILLECEPEMRLVWEKEAFRLFRCCEREFGYNLNQDPTTTKHSPDTIERIRRAHLGKPMSANFRLSCSLRMRGKPSNKKGKTTSIETRRKQRESHLGKTHTDAHKRKISEALKGKSKAPRTAEHCRKISEHRKQYWKKRRQEKLSCVST